MTTLDLATTTPIRAVVLVPTNQAVFEEEWVSLLPMAAPTPACFQG